MTKKNKIAIFAVAAVVLIALSAAVFFYIFAERFDESKMPVDIYYLNPALNMPESERRYITKAETSTIVNKVFEMIYQTPLNKKLVKFPIDGVEILDVQLTDMDERTVLELDFSSEYSNLSPTDELFFRAALVWSLTGLDFITDVNILVAGQRLAKTDGTPLGYLNRENVVIGPEISPDKIGTQDIVLYFPNSELTNMFAEERSVSVNPDVDIEYYIVEQLIAGPTAQGLVSTIPSETKIRRVKREGDTCYVNLNADFISKHTGGMPVQALTIYSIVNSLTELRNVKNVQFLIEAEKVQDFKGGFDLSKPIERDESLIIR